MSKKRFRILVGLLVLVVLAIVWLTLVPGLGFTAVCYYDDGMVINAFMSTCIPHSFDGGELIGSEVEWRWWPGISNYLLWFGDFWKNGHSHFEGIVRQLWYIHIPRTLGMK